MKNDDYYWLRKNSIEQFDSMLLSDRFIRKTCSKPRNKKTKKKRKK